MPINESRPTAATIIQFPVHRRVKGAPAPYAHGATGVFADAPWPTIESGGAWYHEAALREVDRARRT